MRKSLSVAFCSLLFLAACSPISVKTDYDHEVDFGNYQTFKWMAGPKSGKRTIAKNSLVDKRIRRAVENELQAKGYRMIDSGKADALLAYHVSVKNKVDVNSYGYRYWRRRVHVHRYKEGSLILDVVDPRMKQLVWRGGASGIAGDIRQASQEEVNEAVQKVLKKFPPGV